MASVAEDPGGVVGAVVALWRYPVKSMLGEELNAAVITERGLLGDRAHALIDPTTGKVVSAKNPRKWGRLFDCRAAFVEPPLLDRPLPPVRVTLPDGGDIVSGRDDVAAALSSVLGRAVALLEDAPPGPALEQYWPDIEGLAERKTVTDETIALGAPPGTFFDYAALHLLTTTTLDRLRALYPAGRFEARRFRPNLVVAPIAGADGFVENAWVARERQIGEEVRLRVASPCPRCVMTTLRTCRVTSGSCGRWLSTIGSRCQHSVAGPHPAWGSTVLWSAGEPSAGVMPSACCRK
jgi:uncharacterized protein YcbX